MRRQNHAMPQPILFAAAALALLSALPTRAAPTCTAARQVVERFISADCETCWGAGSAQTLPASTWVLDWIAPGTRGAEAPLAVASLPEAAERLQALGNPPLTDGALQGTRAVTPANALRMSVAGGPAWNRYLGLQLSARGKPPAGAVAYLALVEDVPAGSDGTMVARRLLRAVAGPLPLDPSGRATTQLRALRIPEGAKPERLQGVAWWVDGRQQIGGIVREGCPRAP